MDPVIQAASLIKETLLEKAGVVFQVAGTDTQDRKPNHTGRE